MELPRVSATNRYGLAIGSIACNYAIATAVHGEVGSAWALASALVTIWLVFAVSEAPRVRRLAAVALPISFSVAILVSLAHSGRNDTVLQTGLVITNMALYTIAPLVIVRHIFRRPVVDAQTMNGAIAAYLLIGMAFAYAFSAIGFVQSDPPLFGADGPGTMPQVLFFSFITLTTTGYGNLVPAANPAQTLAVGEAIIGQLFLVTAVAKIVTAWRMGGVAEHVSDPGE
jgi:hypothetical protein